MRCFDIIIVMNFFACLITVKQKNATKKDEVLSELYLVDSKFLSVFFDLR